MSPLKGSAVLGSPAGYDADRAGARAGCMKIVVRQPRKLVRDTPLSGAVDDYQYLRIGPDLSQMTQADRDAIALQKNNRPRKVLGSCTTFN